MKGCQPKTFLTETLLNRRITRLAVLKDTATVNLTRIVNYVDSQNEMSEVLAPNGRILLSHRLQDQTTLHIELSNLPLSQMCILDTEKHE